MSEVIENLCKPCSRTKECQFDDNGVDTITGCVLQADGTTSCPENNPCSPWELSQSNETCIISDYIQENINIGGSPLNVHKLLGVHEQGSLTDLTGSGASTASSYLGNFPPSNAFTTYDNEWRSSELGTDVLGAFIGYDFGEYRLINDRLRYGLETYVKKNISSIRIMQGCNANNRATQVRIERSVDGQKWFGVALVNVADCDGWTTINFPASVPSRFWRIRPLKFNGGPEDWWSVRAIQLLEHEATTVTNIQDMFWLENRDRDYQEIPVSMKGAYTPTDTQSMSGKWGFMFDADNYYIEVSFKDTISKLGRPFVIGDIIQLPSETQYTPAMVPVLKYLEVTDVGWSTNGYTPTWQPTMQKLTAKQALASQETQDIFGKMTRDIDDSGLFDIDDGVNNKRYQDYSAITQNIEAESNNMVPVKGEDFADVLKFSPAVIEWGDKHGKNMRAHDRVRNVYGIDAMPPNGEPYTQGDEFPSAPNDGDFHRLTYTYIGTDIPARLHRWSGKKNRWIYLERDHRAEIRDAKPRLQSYLDSDRSSVTSPSQIADGIKKDT